MHATTAMQSASAQLGADRYSAYTEDRRAPCMEAYSVAPLSQMFEFQMRGGRKGFRFIINAGQSFKMS